MGSNTSTNTDTNNIYTEQQYVETMEDKYAELLRQNELLRQENEKAKEDNQKLKEENELLKLGNYNLKRDNDNLRGDIYNLRLENSGINDDKEMISRELDELELQLQELEKKLPKTDLLPKVAEKEKCYKFMNYCAEYHDGRNNSIEVKNSSITNMMNDLSEYLVYSSLSCGGSNILLITNKGKSFVYRECHGSRPGGYVSSTFETLYLDFEVREMNESILNSIIIMNERNDAICGVIHWKITYGHISVRVASNQATSCDEFYKMFN